MTLLPLGNDNPREARQRVPRQTSTHGSVSEWRAAWRPEPNQKNGGSGPALLQPALDRGAEDEASPYGCVACVPVMPPGNGTGCGAVYIFGSDPFAVESES